MIMLLHRIGHFFYRLQFPFLPNFFRNLIFLISRCYIPSSAEIGEGTIFGYGGMCLVIHANAKVGKNCVIGHGVTIGAAEGFAGRLANKCPEIGDNCYIATGSKILGDIKVGNNCTIAAGAIVLKDVPDNAVIVGVPGRIIKMNESGYKAIRRD